MPATQASPYLIDRNYDTAQHPETPPYAMKRFGAAYLDVMRLAICLELITNSNQMSSVELKALARDGLAMLATDFEAIDTQLYKRNYGFNLVLPSYGTVVYRFVLAREDVKHLRSALLQIADMVGGDIGKVQAIASAALFSVSNNGIIIE